MSDVIDLNEKRNERERPEANCIMRDDFGREMYRFGLNYEMDGGTSTTHVWAYSWEDAENRVRAMRESLTIFGQLYATIPG